MRILPNKKENAHVFLLVRAGDAIHKINFTWPKGVKSAPKGQIIRFRPFRASFDVSI